MGIMGGTPGAIGGIPVFAICMGRGGMGTGGVGRAAGACIGAAGEGPAENMVCGCWRDDGFEAASKRSA